MLIYFVGGGRGRGFNHGGSRDKFRSDDDGWSRRNEEGVRWRLTGGGNSLYNI